MTVPAERDEILPPPPIAFRPPSSLFAVVCAEGRLCAMRVMRGRQVVATSSDDAQVIADNLNEDVGEARCFAGPHRVVEYRSVSAYFPWWVIHQDGGVCSAGGLVDIPFTDELAARRTAAMLDRQPVDGPLPSCPRRPHGVRPVEDPR